MLLSLSIRDFVLVDRVELEFGPGFAALTGETGAGKSILLDALGLALGERAENGVVREGAERAEIAAAFVLDDAPEAGAWLRDNGLDEEAGPCLLRRLIDAGGRSRAFINGRPATLGQLRELGECLIDIHGQHAHYALLRPGVQRQWLDAYAGCTALAREVAQAWQDWQAARKTLEEALRADAASGAERERLQWQVDELTRLAFDPDDWLRLQEEHRRLAHAAELIQGAQAVVAALDGDEQGVLPRLSDLHGRINDLAGLDASLAEPAALLDASLLQAREAARELARYADRLELDPEALALAEARIAEINAAARKYRVSVDALPARLAEAEAGLAALDRLADPESLRMEAERTEAEYRRLAQLLSRQRGDAATRLGAAVSEAMQRLSMKGGRFAARLEACAAEAGGLENVDFQVAPHAGQTLRSLARTASGGELSRIGLALQTLLSRVSGAATLIFDEVDAGIGGGVAEIVGRMLAELGQTRQVLCVTHLPQVAAHAGRHWRIRKESESGRAATRVERLDDPQRVEEVARMLGGVELTETTRQHAREMLIQAGTLAAVTANKKRS